MLIRSAIAHAGVRITAAGAAPGLRGIATDSFMKALASLGLESSESKKAHQERYSIIDRAEKTPTEN